MFIKNKKNEQIFRKKIVKKEQKSLKNLRTNKGKQGANKNRAKQVK